MFHELFDNTLTEVYSNLTCLKTLLNIDSTTLSAR